MKKDSRKSGQGGAESPSPKNESESFGAWLSRQRTGRGIELKEIAESSKISLQYLKAFEADRFDMLPADVFAKGFLRQYASYVGLDPEEVINFYLTASQEEADDELPEPKPKNPSAGSTTRLVAIAVVMITLLVALVWWLSRQTENTPSAASTVAVGQQPDLNPAGGSEEVEEPGSSAATTDGAAMAISEDPAEGAAPGPDGLTPAAPSGEATVPPNDAATTTGSPPQTAATPATTPSSAPSADSFRVVAEFADSCWVEARVDGERRVSMTKVQGESLILRAEESVDFIFGNVEAVRLEVDGRTFPLTPRRGTPRLAVHIDRSVLDSLTPATTRTPENGGTSP